MKKTNQTKKLVLDRQTIRELSPQELESSAGGFAIIPDTKRRTASCMATCPPCVIDG